MEKISYQDPSPEAEIKLLRDNERKLLAKQALVADRHWKLLEEAADKYCDQLLDNAKVAATDLKGIGEKISDPNDRLLIFIKKIRGGLVTWHGDNTETDKQLKQLKIEDRKIVLNEKSRLSKLPTPTGGLYEKMQERLISILDNEERGTWSSQEAELSGLRSILIDTRRKIANLTDLESQDSSI